MTTLPQTTPIRLPRVVGSSTLAVPAGAQAAAGMAPSLQMSPGDVWRVIRSNLWLIVLLVAASAVGGYFVNDYWAKYHSVYSSYGLLRIRPPQPGDPLHGPQARAGASLAL